MNKYQFDFSGLSAEQWQNYQKQLKQIEADAEDAIKLAETYRFYNDEDFFFEPDFVGCIRAGELAFDVVCRLYNNHLHGSPYFILTFDCYVGGIDSGYGYSNRDPQCPEYPYDEYDGGDFQHGNCKDMSYEYFKQVAEKELAEFIDGSALLQSKANEPLHVW